MDSTTSMHFYTTSYTANTADEGGAIYISQVSESGPSGLTREVETPLPSNSPRMRPGGTIPLVLWPRQDCAHTLPPS
jgi:hypothetical protein